MVDVRRIIQDMARRGMGAEEIIGTLKELGVPDAEQVFREAIESLREMPLAPPGEGTEGAQPEGAEAPRAEEKPIQLDIPGGEKKTPDIEKMMSEEGAALAETADVKELKRKLDEMEALLKALQDTVKQVLETDRDVLLRLKRQ